MSDLKQLASASQVLESLELPVIDQTSHRLREWFEVAKRGVLKKDE